MFKSSWWKVLGAVLVLTSIYLGTSVKTGPGIASVSPEMIDPGKSFTVSLVGYNTRFDSNEPVAVWMKYKSGLFCASDVKVLDENHINVTFDAIPARLDSVQRIVTSLLIEDRQNGMFLALDVLRLDFSTDSISTPGVCAVMPQKLETAYFGFPFRTTLYESIRNLHFHVPMWFTMITLLLISFIYSILYLNRGNKKYDNIAHAFAGVGLMFGIIGIVTGALWARFTWGTFWTTDPKLNGAAVAVLMYIAYQILRTSIEDEDKVARISAVYNILAYPIFIVLILVLPKLAQFSLHPGSGDSVGFNQYDLNSNLRMVFYPAVLGWILTGIWLAQLTFRIKNLEQSANETV